MQIVPKRRQGRELSRLQRQMTDVMDRLFGFERPDLFETLEWAPLIDLSETNGDVQIKAELPGIKKEDINVDITGDMLTISGEKREEKEEEESGFFSKERYFGKFQRQVRLPAQVKSEEAKAVFKDGVLSILVPKKETSGKRRIEITEE
jgi:HSP20 family protein